MTVISSWPTPGLRIALFFTSFGLACATIPSRAEQPRQQTIIAHPGLFPETIVEDPSGAGFLVGSLRDGGVYRVDREGRTTRLVDDERLCSVLGIAIDDARGWVWVTNADLGKCTRPSAAGPRHVAAVATYELATGRLVRYVDLAGLLPDAPHLPNGIALDREGRAYVTDSLAPVVYEVDTEGHARVLVRDERFEGEGINLNGVVVHPDGYLLVVKKSDGSLFKIPLDAPTQLTRIALPRALHGGDGLSLADPERAVLVANHTASHANDALFVLASDDAWASARIDASRSMGPVYPTTATIDGASVLVLHSRLDTLIGAAEITEALSVERAVIERVDLPLRGAFVYLELQTSGRFADAKYDHLLRSVDAQPGFVDATWLAGIDDGAVGGLLSFDRIEDARRFVAGFLTEEARRLDVAQTSRIFDASVVERASREMGSVHFGAPATSPPGAFVYTEVQVHVPFADVPWTERNRAIRANAGFQSKTWLSSVDTGTVGGLYAFDTVENAKRFAIDAFARSAAKQRAPYTTRVFDAHATVDANRATRSPYYR